MSGTRKRSLMDLQPQKRSVVPKDQRMSKVSGSSTSVPRKTQPTEVRRSSGDSSRLTKQELINIHTTLKETLQARKHQLANAKKEKKALEAEIRRLEGKSPMVDSDSDSY